MSGLVKKITILSVLTLLILPGKGRSSDFIEIQKQDDGLLVLEEGREVLFYQTAPKSHNGEYQRTNYIHPLYSLEGSVLTEDFPEDHLHQRGIFWAWHQIVVNDQRVADQWTLENFDWVLQDVSIDESPLEYSELQVTFHWESPNYTDESGNTVPFVEEISTVRIYPTREFQDTLYQQIDFHTALRSINVPVSIGGSEDAKGYGGFSLRIKLPDDMLFLGENGLMKPQTTAVDAGSWMDFTGSLEDDGSRAGMTVLTHPSLPLFPPPWIIRAKNSMQNPVFPGRDLFQLPTEKPLELFYRVLIHDGDLKPVRIDKLQQEFESVEF